MKRRLEIAPGVRNVLRDQLMEWVDMREHTVLRCPFCERDIPPDADVAAALSAAVGPDGVVIAFVTHVDCLPSRVVDTDERLDDLFAPDREQSIGTWSVLRLSAFPRAALVLEAHSWLEVRGAALDAKSQQLVEDGWSVVTDELRSLSAPRVEGLRVVLGHEIAVFQGDSALLWGSDPADLPAGWIEVAMEEDAVLVVHGRGLGFDRLSVDRVDQALQAGQCVGAVGRPADGEKGH